MKVSLDAETWIRFRGKAAQMTEVAAEYGERLVKKGKKMPFDVFVRSGTTEGRWTVRPARCRVDLRGIGVVDYVSPHHRRVASQRTGDGDGNG